MIIFFLLFSFLYDYSCSDSSICNYTEISLNQGIYKFELWGAQGGTGCTDGVHKLPGGHGSYVSGYIKINKKTNFYLYIGGKGGNGSHIPNSQAKSGWNGGGKGGIDWEDNDGSGGGGGSTDIRLLPGEWDNITSLRSRIIVAAGGSGSAFNHYGSSGGTIFGFKKNGISFNSIINSSSTSQIMGNLFGIGEDGKTFNWVPSSGAGGGYYGGVSVSGSQTIPYPAISDSGSSFISGHNFCNSISIDGFHTNTSYHYSGLLFFNSTMKSGIEIQPNYLNNLTIIGKTNNGAIRIIFLDQNEITNKNSYNINLFKICFFILIK